jgi:regulator of protease activity HflC (stomatin/prohibitin superfamily)
VAAELLVAIAAVVVLFVLVRSLRFVPAEHAATVDTRERVLTLAPQHVRTSDEFAVTFEPTVTVQVAADGSARVEIANHDEAIEQLTATALHSLAGGLSREQVWSSRAWLTTEVHAVLQSAAATWGLRIVAVEIKLKR